MKPIILVIKDSAFPFREGTIIIERLTKQQANEFKEQFKNFYAKVEIVPSEDNFTDR